MAGAQEIIEEADERRVNVPSPLPGARCTLRRGLEKWLAHGPHSRKGRRLRGRRRLSEAPACIPAPGGSLRPAPRSVRLLVTWFADGCFHGGGAPVFLSPPFVSPAFGT